MNNCECNICLDCDEFDEDIEEVLEVELIGKAVSEIFEALPCPHCVADVVTELAYKFKDIGWDNHKDFIREINED